MEEMQGGDGKSPSIVRITSRHCGLHAQLSGNVLHPGILVVGRQHCHMHSMACPLRPWHSVLLIADML